MSGSDHPRQGRTEVAQGAFLAAYAQTGNITAAAKAAGIARQSHYDWLAADPEYAKRFADAHEEAIERLEAEARRRASVGVEEPVYYKGKQIGAVRRYSDTLLIFLLKAARPSVYRDRVDVTHDDAARKAVAEASDEELLEAADKLRATVEARRGGDGG